VLSVYDTSRKSIVGTRLDKVKVIVHNPYDPDGEDEADDTPPPAPVPKSSPKPAPKPAPADDLNDDLPF